MSNDDAEARIKPYQKEFDKTYAEGRLNDLARFYDKNAVVVEAGKKVYFGQEEIVKSFVDAEAEFGRATFTLLNAKYEGATDYVIIDADFEMKGEKGPLMKGHFVQIWRKSADVYIIYHEEYAF